jgi:hypothetical protein
MTAGQLISEATRREALWHAAASRDLVDADRADEKVREIRETLALELAYVGPAWGDDGWTGGRDVTAFARPGSLAERIRRYGRDA